MRKLKFAIIPIIGLLVGMISCAAPPKPPERIPPPEVKPRPFEISDVTIDSRVFNPKKGEMVTISYRLSRPAKAIVKIFDPDMRLVTDLPGAGTEKVGRVMWDGSDFEGRVVPDEAYFFTIEALDYQGNFTFYDPTTFSGGEGFAPLVEFDSKNGAISYELPQDARVSIRAGISEGPLLKTILNWAPRLAGRNEEVWDGKDESGNIDAVSQKGYRLMAEAISLPANSILTSGNTDYTYLEYRNDIAPDRPKKVDRPLFESERTLMGLQLERPIREGPEPRFRMELPQDIEKNEDGLPIVRGKVPVKIYLDEKIKRYITEQRYEIICFVDFTFVTEKEEGYSPCTWAWDTGNVPNGKHILTVNVATLTGQVASASMKVMVEN